jgi:hypothetical protein
MGIGEEFLLEVCKIKHEVIDKDVSEIKEDIEEIKKEERSQHEEIKELIAKLSGEIKFSHQNLKDKIILNDKIMGDKIDELNDFDKGLRGNGDPGVWESVRTNKESIKLTRKIGCWIAGVLTTAILAVIIITLGGSWHGVSKKTIKEESPFSQKEKQVKTAPKVAKTTPKVIKEIPKFRILK